MNYWKKIQRYEEYRIIWENQYWVQQLWKWLGLDEDCDEEDLTTKDIQVIEDQQMRLYHFSMSWLICECENLQDSTISKHVNTGSKSVIFEREISRSSTMISVLLCHCLRWIFIYTRNTQSDECFDKRELRLLRDLSIMRWVQKRYI